MYEKIVVVDDDFGTLKQIETILKHENYMVATFQSAKDALNAISGEEFSCDVIISDFHMPEINGYDFLVEFRKKYKYIPFMILTVNTDISNIIELITAGADDYITKPVVKEDLIFRIQKNIEQKKNQQFIDRINKENEITKLDKQRLANWKELYATKDSKQVENFLKLMTRSINQGGGAFTWLDLLKNNVKEIDEKSYQISKNLVKIIINSTEQNKQFFDNLTLLSTIDNLEMNFQQINLLAFTDHISEYVSKSLRSLADSYSRIFKIQTSNHQMKGEILVEMETVKKIIFELFVNAIKYSPAESEIIYGFEKISILLIPWLTFSSKTCRKPWM